jgi:hypothetical protein
MPVLDALFTKPRHQLMHYLVGEAMYPGQERQLAGDMAHCSQVSAAQGQIWGGRCPNQQRLGGYAWFSFKIQMSLSIFTGR